MPSFTDSRFTTNTPMSTSLHDAVAISGKTIAIFIQCGDKAVELVDHIERATPAQIKLSEQMERGRVRLFGFNHGMSYEQACALNAEMKS